MADQYEDIKHVVQLDTNVEMGCEHCDTWTGGHDGFAASVNHYIEAHGYQLLHVGTDTGVDSNDGSARPITMAILGK